MSSTRLAWLVLGLILVVPRSSAMGREGADGPPALEGPAEDPRNEAQLAARPRPSEPVHEAFLSLGKDSAKGAREGNLPRIEQSPPAPLNDPPKGEPPVPGARWVEGYWAWDDARHDFDWISGAWRVSPPGKFWVNGVWKRDDRGWYRVPGSWSERKVPPGDPVRSDSERAADVPDWRSQGPPDDRPEEKDQTAPGPDFFFVPGEYVPNGNSLVWRPGFWSRSVPGWEWVAASWVRLSSGWAFRDGYWDRLEDESGTVPRASGSRPGNLTARPTASRSPFTVGEASRRAAPGRQSEPSAASDLQPIPPDGRDEGATEPSDEPFPRAVVGPSGPGANPASGGLADPLNAMMAGPRASASSVDSVVAASGRSSTADPSSLSTAGNGGAPPTPVASPPTPYPYYGFRAPYPMSVVGGARALVRGVIGGFL
jgi:hypothetical protein